MAHVMIYNCSEWPIIYFHLIKLFFILHLSLKDQFYLKNINKFIPADLINKINAK